MNKLFEKLTNQMAETIDSSVALALHNKNQEVEVIHLLWALLTNTNSVLNQLLNKMNVNKAAIELEAKSYASKLPSVSTVTNRITSYNVCYTKLLRFILKRTKLLIEQLI